MTVEYLQIVNNEFLNNPQVKKEDQMEIRKYFETNYNEYDIKACEIKINHKCIYQKRRHAEHQHSKVSKRTAI